MVTVARFLSPLSSASNTCRRITFPLALFAAVVFILSTPGAMAQSGAENAASKQVQALLDSAHKASGNPGALRSVVTRHFAVGTWSNAVLGKSGRKFSSSQKSRFRNLFPSYIAKQYFKQFGSSGAKAGSVGKARTVRGDVLVSSRIPNRTRTFTVTWRMRNIGGKPRVIDYTVGGISAVVLRRSEFGAKVKRSGPDGLIDFIKAFIES